MQCKACGQENPPEAQFCAGCGASLVTAAEPIPQAAAVPSAPAVPAAAVQYAGFWRRLAAALIDSLDILFLYLILWSLVGSLFWLPVTYIPLSPFTTPLGSIWIAWLYFWLFTGLKGQTPGKKMLHIKVVDKQGNTPGLGRAALREIIGKTVSSLSLGLGFLWIIWDRQKQGWHDKIAGTYVVPARK